MKKLFLASTFVLGTLLLFAQNRKTITTEDGAMIVKTDAQTLKDYIEFSVSGWNSITQGTTYTVDENSSSIGITICLIIANRNEKHCKSGIGFRCGFIECPPPISDGFQATSNGQHADRVYSASYAKNGNTVVLKFNEKVDWDWLAN